MKETKVYLDELPESCSKCEYCTLNHKDNYGRPFCLIARMPLYNGDKVKEERGQYKDSLSDFNCPLIDIKTHDRELVKEVCDDLALSLIEFSEDFTMSRDEILEWLQKYKDQIKKGV